MRASGLGAALIALGILIVPMRGVHAQMGPGGGQMPDAKAPGQLPAMGGGGQMPDPKAMSGKPLPVGDLAPGTVTVRVVRGSMANPIAGHAVELAGPGAPAGSKTDDAGRAEFTGLQPGTRVKASAVVDGEKLESEEFAIPQSGGIRVALVATDPDAVKRAAEDERLAQAPAQAGMVVLGEQSRFVIEMGDESLNVFNIIEIVNTARVPVQPPETIAFDLPAEAQGAGVLEGSSKQAVVMEKTVSVAGPFAPGSTVVQFAYSVPFSGARLTLGQKLPAPLNQLSVMAQKVGEMHLTSPQFAQHREMSAEGQTYIVAQGNGLKAGDTLTLNFSGLPHAPSWPRNAALALAAVILAGGGWALARGGKVRPAESERRRQLTGQRERLFAELTALEDQHRGERVDAARYATRRRELIAALERVYVELDEEAAA